MLQLLGVKRESPIWRDVLRFAERNEALKELDKRSSHSKGAEEKTNESRAAERALRDLSAVLKESEGAIFTVVAVERMREYSGYWQSYKGNGLDQTTLASLIQRFGVQGKSIKVSKSNPHRMQGHASIKTVGQGYFVSDIRASLPAQTEGE
jgi:hypothetical protein